MTTKAQYNKSILPSKFITRKYTRCTQCGRSKAVFRKFKLCRICFRLFAHKGYLPGVMKSSW